MSHLPLDARAILQHLNDLGYRNISAEQLREFLKGMQPQSDKQGAGRLATTTSHPTAAATATAAATTTTPPKVKVIKSKRPLCHFKFYLDICDHQLAKRIESDIKALGGNLEFFLSDSITHFVTDKPELGSGIGGGTSGVRTPGTPGTPGTPTSHYQDDGCTSARKPNQRQSRADAILSRVRRSTVGVGATNSGSNPPTPTTGAATKRSYTIWQADYAQRFIKRIQTELKQYLEGKKEAGGGGQLAGAGAGAGAGSALASPHKIQLKKQYVKIESVKRSYRPYYHLIKQPDDWPKIDLSSEDGAFRLLTKAKAKEKKEQQQQKEQKEQQQSMTRKSLGSHTSQKDKEKLPLQNPALQQLKKQSAIAPNSPRSNFREAKESSEQQGGVCEICKLEYDTLNIHLQSKDHELFAKNPENFLALDSLINSSANVNRFLEEEAPIESDCSEMDVDESTMSNEDQKRPSPALRERSKRITKGKHSSEKFQASAASPQTPSPGAGSGKKPQPGSLLELQRQEHPTTAAATPTTTAGRRKTQNSGFSPPIRAMLPPSSLYKVVETREECTTPPRRGRPGANQVDSPSLIVKFQKVRQTELQRLNGEAENFMFPRTAAAATRSSSELATDIDRQTTSDARGRCSISSASLDTSTSEAETKESTGLPNSGLRKRAQAVGRRRKVLGDSGPELLQRQLSTGSSSSNSNQQRFPSAPIQPDERPEPEPEPAEPQPQLKMKVKAMKLKIKQEEPQQVATRKSSRTATAIVTAATASSRHQQQQLRQTTGRKLAVKLEDRMGESTNKTKTKQKKQLQVAEDDEEGPEPKTEKQQSLQKFEEVLLDQMEEELEMELETSGSSGSDEEYVVSKATKSTTRKAAAADTREQRAARRLSRLTINRSAGELEQTSPDTNKSSPTRGVRKSSSPTKAKGKQAKAAAPAVDLIFDCAKSERLQSMQYTFESLPSGELWSRVFLRQDAGEEHYYTYYGSTRYRKLPYEMGPIPMARTSAHTCSLCRGLNAEKTEVVPEKQLPKKEIKTEEEAPSPSSSSMYKHKKLHLLQRYQQEQEQLHQQQQQQQLEGNPLATAIAKCDSKASTPELLEREFASGSLGDRVQLIERVRSTSSSSCSNSQRSGITCRNKQLARIAELPPRKSPREHASTLALVSCIIRQRQDSQSKTNSEAEDPPPPVVMPKLKTPVKQEPVAATVVAAVMPASPRTTRSQAATPVEELRFATEISETVKRMRRGQNKYDHSPPAPMPSTSSPARSRRLPPNSAANQSLGQTYSRRLEFAAATANRREAAASSRKRRANAAGVTPVGRPPNAQQQNPTGPNAFRGVRKLPSKKGVLEYEMEPCALKILDQAMQYSNPGFVAWQLDKYLELAGREYDIDADVDEPSPAPPAASGAEETRERLSSPQTPPPTDCFTSEFDLCDLLVGSAGSGDDEEDAGRGGGLPGSSRRMNSSNLYSSYYKKRKSLKSNRTGWPKAHRRRNAGGLAGNRSLPDERINFQKMGLGEMRSIKQEPMETEEEQTTTTTTTTTTSSTREKLLSKEDEDDEGGGGGQPGGEDSRGGGDDATANDKQNAREDAVMTPPATDVDEAVENDQEEVDPEPDENESLPEEDETMADSVDQPQDDEAEIEATDADVEEEDEEEEDEDVFEDAYEEHEESGKAKTSAGEPPEKRSRIPSIAVSSPPEEHSSPGKKLLLTLHNGQRLSACATSTPSTAASQRRTPQLNGSLGSCISPSEKLGDNSDIFTVSSDGLDTDLDLSNTQAGDSHEHCPHQPPSTPKRKFDISKYAPPNNGKAASSCAAEAATAAVKSLAISQFLKKEVRVTCRRLRAPFRRFRYRR